jgi:hypothetical protein
VAFTLPACFSLRAILAARTFLSGSPERFTLRTPVSLHSICVRCRSRRRSRSATYLPCASYCWLRARARASRYADQPPANSRVRCECSSISTMRSTARSRKARSCDTTSTAPGAVATNASSWSSPAKSRLFVGSSSSRTSWRDRRTRQQAAGGLAARQRGHGLTQTSVAAPVVAEADGGRHLGGAGLEVVAAEGEVAVEGEAVGVERVGIVRERLRAAVELGVRVGHAGAPGQVGQERLPRAGRALGVAHGEGLGLPDHAAAIGHLHPGEHPQQRGLAHAVRPDHTHAVTRVELDGHLVEDHLATVPASESGSTKHPGTLPAGQRPPHRVPHGSRQGSARGRVLERGGPRRWGRGPREGSSGGKLDPSNPEHTRPSRSVQAADAGTLTRRSAR